MAAVANQVPSKSERPEEMMSWLLWAEIFAFSGSVGAAAVPAFVFLTKLDFAGAALAMCVRVEATLKISNRRPQL